ncbi:DUF3500 domain-containing protein [Rhodohalobacter sulfatireducens]|uniref:DUF3500 domain-containing protein n=1 Tax=Rhodohalobacter sulfatireducens TaxID=2911366 RepID=A0ABS9KH40_9BACT|nr:DUF3500 domain-containing protein [Rhodohalobacter sulfatireducens]MCG2590155.1 DUF3500 domain-containing protein [Rhodohalobacter sulfatireducens]
MKYTLLAISLFSLSFFSTQIPSDDSANEFLASLNEEQHEKAQKSFDDLTRHTWHFLPAAMWPRPGIPLHELNENQKELLFDLLQEFLSESGYDKTLSIIELENVLAEIENNPDFRDPDLYFATFYGEPNNDDKWAWSFEGHHISLNFTVVEGEVSMVPRFLGARPSLISEGSREGEKTALHREEDLGIELIQSMSDEQLDKAIFLETAFWEIVTNVATETGPLTFEGIMMGELNEDQQVLLLDIINEYLSAMPEELAEQRYENLKNEEFNDIEFAWAGATELGEAHYYRVQGETFLIEFDNTQDDANHIHTVWRDFDGDFGKDLLRQHYHNSPHHQH